MEDYNQHYGFDGALNEGHKLPQPFILNVQMENAKNWRHCRCISLNKATGILLNWIILRRHDPLLNFLNQKKVRVGKKGIRNHSYHIHCDKGHNRLKRQPAGAQSHHPSRIMECTKDCNPTTHNLPDYGKTAGKRAAMSKGSILTSKISESSSWCNLH